MIAESSGVPVRLALKKALCLSLDPIASIEIPGFTVKGLSRVNLARFSPPLHYRAREDHSVWLLAAEGASISTHHRVLEGLPVFIREVEEVLPVNARGEAVPVFSAAVEVSADRQHREIYSLTGSVSKALGVSGTSETSGAGVTAFGLGLLGRERQ